MGLEVDGSAFIPVMTDMNVAPDSLLKIIQCKCKLHPRIHVAVTYVTRSVKTRHNRASLNFQYKALNTMGKIFVYY